MRWSSSSVVCSVALLPLALLLVGPAAGVAGSAPLPAPPTCRGERATIVGTPERDDLVGTPGPDVIVGLAGWDRIDGRRGNDLVCGGPGSDTLRGGPGDDLVLGQDDGFYRDEGRFYVGDTLTGGPGVDALVGGDDRAGDEVFFPSIGHGVRVDLAAGTATGQGRDTLEGIGDVTATPFDDVVLGSTGGTDLDTGAGDDRVETGEGWAGYARLGSGADRLVAPGTRVYAELGDGADVAEVGGGDLLAGDGDDQVTGTGSAPAGLGVEGEGGDDLITGTAGDDDVLGGAGDDVVRLGEGDDYVSEGPGADRVDAGVGDDWVQGGRGDDVLDGGDGVDLVDYLQVNGDAGIVLDLAAGTVRGVAGSDAISGFEKANGSSQRDEIFGTDGDDVLDGDSGRGDVLHGRGGDDRLTVRFGSAAMHGDAGDDTLLVDFLYGNLDGLSFDGGEGRDLFVLGGYVGDRRDVRLDLAAGEITGAGRAPLVGVEDLTDNGGGHTLVGDDGPNVLRGRRGADTIVGNGGDDTGDGGGGVDACDTEVSVACES